MMHTRPALALLPPALLTLLWAPPAAAQPVAKVIVAEAQVMQLPATIRLVGTVRPNRVSVLGTEVEGLVADLPVREGDYVESQNVVCLLKDDILLLELQAANEKLASLQAAVDMAEANLQRWSLEKQRVTRLSEQDKANPKELYDTVAEHLIAKNQLREAQLQVAEQTALVELKTTELGKTAIRAPFNGYVTRLHTEIGQWIQQGGAVVEVIDLESVLVRVDAPEAAIPFIRVGDGAEVKIDALDDSFSGHIKHVVPQAHEKARTFPVDIEIANPAHKLRSGLFARATVRSGPPSQAVAVMKDAIVQKKGTDRIWMIQQAGPEGTLAVPLPVTLGAEVGEWVAITSGNVSAGMKVVVRGNERLMPFPSAVQVVKAHAPTSGASPADHVAAERPLNSDTPTAAPKHAAGTR